MNRVRGLPPVPADRNLPYGRLEQRRANLVRLVEADLKPVGVRSRLRSLRAWLITLIVVVVLLVLGSSALLAGRASAVQGRVAVETVTLVGSGSIVASLGARPRFLAGLSTRHAQRTDSWKRADDRTTGPATLLGAAS